MRKITDFLGEAQKDFGDALAGKRPQGGFDGPPLPETRQYRATISRGEWRQAVGSGNWQYAFTFEVTEPEEYAGRKFTEYYSIEAGAHNAAKEKFATLIGASGVNSADAQDTGNTEADNSAFASLFEGTNYVVATRVWGTDNDRTGLRYLNKDYGQKLQEKIEPPKKGDKGTNLGKRGGQGVAGSLSPDITVSKNQNQETAEVETQATPPIGLPGGSSPSGVRLPPGLRRE